MIEDWFGVDGEEEEEEGRGIEGEREIGEAR